ncbi:Tyrosine-protein phosphatase YwqE [Muriicola jejuensis]|uniref:protein-tyrosine-phosphatase n=1 Tax=Muriicola jejuensis TaxID=504488 RepID=A0A6P0UKD1_9FLAO|nr:CpsB/CapC family capsule biosynthesis tyrosine phosphatase [Muriicola jejuensis]NER11513.1 histidinol phosphatase [Muriicola jejuensis]SMP20201.1 Tyrosine-protein phosphatase YwqE [Muriicola jejuensis]
MFHIFSRKRFLVDALEGFVDIHNHILPGIDDGAKTVEDSIAMIREFESFGVTHFIATPHIMNDYYPNTPETIRSSYSKLRDELIAKKLDHITIGTAAEHMIDGHFEAILKKNEVMPLSEDYLLIEMSYLQASMNLEESIGHIASYGFFPVLAHPERYVYWHGRKSTYHKYRKDNVRFQMNLLSLSDYYGMDIKREAHRLLSAGIYDFVGSDVHNLRHLEALKNVQIVPRILDKVNPLIQNTIREFY